MKMQKTKSFAAIIATLLMLSMTISMLPFVSAAYNTTTQDAIDDGMNWDLPQNASATRLLMWERYQDKVPTWVYSVIAPNPVGVGQQFSMVVFNPQVPVGASEGNDIRYKYHVIVTKPDGSTERLPSSGSLVSDSTGTTYTKFTPDTVGNYSVMVVFEELKWTWTITGGGVAPIDYYGVTLLSSNRTYTVEVQQDPVIPGAVTSYPLPTEYWTRPIEGQNNAWGAVSSNWLNSAKDVNSGYTQNRVQRDGIAPNSGHILWTRQTEDGGVVGGNSFDREGQTFNAGHQYQTRYAGTQIIMGGRLLYQEPIAWAGTGTAGGTGGDWVCVDLKTGQEVWRNDTMTLGVGAQNITPQFGYYYDLDDMNQHGIINPGYIISQYTARSGTANINCWAFINPRYGTTIPLNVTNVPTGVDNIGPQGEILRFVIQNDGTSLVPDYHIYQWNSSRVFRYENSGSRNGSLAAMQPIASTYSAPSITTWDFNVSLGNRFATTPTIRMAAYGDVMLISNGSLPTSGTSSLYYHNPEEATLTAVSLKEGQEGRILWSKNYQMTFEDGTQRLFIRAADGVFVMQTMPTLTWEVFDVTTGNRLWASEPQADFNPFGYYSWVSLMNVYGSTISNGKLFTTGYTGSVYAYDLYNGTLCWKQEAPTGGEIFKYYTLFHGVTADGKIYIGTHEHSADAPLLKGAQVRAFDVNTGEYVWSMLGWAHPGTIAVADGVLTYWNNYDHQVYAVGKGASSTTVDITNDVVKAGSSVMIKGTVTDISPGTQQSEQSLRFPNGVPAVSDASQSAWMEYVYMQKPRPTNVTGVTVDISVVDANGNYRSIGTTTADSDGFYSLNWMPDIEGKFQVYASFLGSESYWPSHAVTAFNVDPAPATPTPVPTAAPTAADLYFIPAIIGLFVAIIVVGLLTIMMTKKHP
jgi:outer membrane protein assembly factor BamB